MNNDSNDLKDLYSQTMQQEWAQTSGRDAYGERELKTLELLIAEVGPQLPKAGKVLDLGCGDKFLQPACARRNLEYTGLDYDTVNFEKDKLPVESNSVDVGLS